MKIKFSTYGQTPRIITKEDAEKMLRNVFEDSRVDLLLLNVLSHRPMIVNIKGTTIKIEAVEE